MAPHTLAEHLKKVSSTHMDPVLLKIKIVKKITFVTYIDTQIETKTYVNECSCHMCVSNVYKMHFAKV